MRLFVGIALPENLADVVEATITRLCPTAPELRWSPASNLHITTKFIGEWPEARLEEMKSALATLPAHSFDVQLGGFGWFPNPHSPRVFWLAARGGEAIVNLAAATDATTARLGVLKETKPYTPHVTLARVKQGLDLRTLRGAVADSADPDHGGFRVNEFWLYRSDPGPAGSVYTKLASYPLSD